MLRWRWRRTAWLVRWRWLSVRHALGWARLRAERFLAEPLLVMADVWWRDEWWEWRLSRVRAMVERHEAERQALVERGWWVSSE